LSQALIVACTAEEDKQRKEKRKGQKGQLVWMAEKGKICQSKTFCTFVEATPNLGPTTFLPPDL
jgi:hypothetical protein